MHASTDITTPRAHAALTHARTPRRKHLLNDPPISERRTRPLVLACATMDGQHRGTGIGTQLGILERPGVVVEASDFACDWDPERSVQLVDQRKDEGKVFH